MAKKDVESEALREFIARSTLSFAKFAQKRKQKFELMGISSLKFKELEIPIESKTLTTSSSVTKANFKARVEQENMYSPDKTRKRREKRKKERQMKKRRLKLVPQLQQQNQQLQTNLLLLRNFFLQQMPLLENCTFHYANLVPTYQSDKTSFLTQADLEGFTLLSDSVVFDSQNRSLVCISLTSSTHFKRIFEKSDLDITNTLLALLDFNLPIKRKELPTSGLMVGVGHRRGYNPYQVEEYFCKPEHRRENRVGLSLVNPPLFEKTVELVEGLGRYLGELSPQTQLQRLKAIHKLPRLGKSGVHSAFVTKDFAIVPHKDDDLHKDRTGKPYQVYSCGIWMLHGACNERCLAGWNFAYPGYRLAVPLRSRVFQVWDAVKVEHCTTLSHKVHLCQPIGLALASTLKTSVFNHFHKYFLSPQENETSNFFLN